jgi:hypothetical protein
MGRFLPFLKTISTKGKQRSVVPLVEVWKIAKYIFIVRLMGIKRRRILVGFQTYKLPLVTKCT